MENQDMVAAREFCVHHKIELSFIQSLQEYGMIETVTTKEQIFVPVSELGKLEKLVRLHFELDINLEGIETITHMLRRMQEMQEQIMQLSNRLKIYE